MENEQLIRSILEKCRIYYDDALISDEQIIADYLAFFSKQFTPAERTTGFAFHTGSLCFDVATIAALMIGSLIYEQTTSEEILDTLNVDDIVLFKGRRYRWGGTEVTSFSHLNKPVKFIKLKEDAKGKNGESTGYYPYEENKHLVRPYNGTSEKATGGKSCAGLKERNDFISGVIGIPEKDIPSTLSVSVVVLADKSEILDICKHLFIEYDGKMKVELTDIVPVSYYTSTNNVVQVGKNPSKAEAVIKIASNTSTARSLVVDKTGNRAIGLVVLNAESLSASDSSELMDMIGRKSLKFVHVTAPLSVESSSNAVEQNEDADVFACTKDWLSAHSTAVRSHNKLTDELFRHTDHIINKAVRPVAVSDGLPWEKYKQIKKGIIAIRQSSWSGEDKENFILSSMALLNLFSTAFFPMRVMESAIADGTVNAAVLSPEARLTELSTIAVRATSMSSQCTEIATLLLEIYGLLYNKSNKETELLSLLDRYETSKIAVVVPKAYYTDIFFKYYAARWPNADIRCITVNRFDSSDDYDSVIVVGNITGKHFDPLSCYSADDIFVLLYESESKEFNYRKRKSTKSEKKLNARIKGLKGEALRKEVETDEPNDDAATEEAIHEFSDLDAYVESMGMFDIRRLVGSAQTGSTGVAEVQYVGTFVTGEQILFSKYYEAVVYNRADSVIEEKSPEKLQPGDVLVFTKKNDYTRNIVDIIFDQLSHSGKLTKEVKDAEEKAGYWKEALREYREKNDLSYRELAKQMKKLGSSLQEMTVRQWLTEESHIIGPRNAETMEIIARLTQDAYLLADPQGYHEACGIIRYYRRVILKLIAQAINDKLSNKEPEPGSAFEVVYDNVENLSESLELERIYALDQSASVAFNLVNRPIMESEVQM